MDIMSFTTTKPENKGHVSIIHTLWPIDLMRHLYFILLFIIFSCQSENRQLDDSESRFSDSIKVDDGLSFDCPLKEFKREYDCGLVIKGVYAACEPDWVYKLVIIKSDSVLFEFDSLTEFQFNDYEFPECITNESSITLLLELDDRPLRNKIIAFQYLDSKLILDTIPLFKDPGKDIDNDGNLEYFETPYTIEPLYPDSLPYLPVIAFEIRTDVFKYDSQATRIINEQIYGEYLGNELNWNKQYHKEKVERNWP